MGTPHLINNGNDWGVRGTRRSSSSTRNHGRATARTNLQNKTMGSEMTNFMTMRTSASTGNLNNTFSGASGAMAGTNATFTGTENRMLKTKSTNSASASASPSPYATSMSFNDVKKMKLRKSGILKPYMTTQSSDFGMNDPGNWVRRND